MDSPWSEIRDVKCDAPSHAESNHVRADNAKVIQEFADVPPVRPQRIVGNLQTGITEPRQVRCNNAMTLGQCCAQSLEDAAVAWTPVDERYDRRLVCVRVAILAVCETDRLLRPAILFNRWDHELGVLDGSSSCGRYRANELREDQQAEIDGNDLSVQSVHG